MKWETLGGMPTKGMEFSQLIDNLRQAEEHASMLGHLHADESELMMHGWLGVAEMLKLMTVKVTELATKGRWQ